MNIRRQLTFRAGNDAADEVVDHELRRYPLDSIEKADPTHATIKPVPYTGVQFVQIPEFQDLGTRVSQEFAGAIAGQQSTTDAIKKGNDYANQVAKQGGYQK